MTSHMDAKSIDNDKVADRFEAREGVMLQGLRLYLEHTFAQYLTNDQIGVMVDLLYRLRRRKVGEILNEISVKPVSVNREIRNLFLPNKQLRRDEMALVLYSLAPYSLLSRKDAAVVAKQAFPFFFGSVETINTMFTKLYGLNDYIASLPLIRIPEHSTDSVETVLYDLATNVSHS